jgi:hypothetical protein
MDEEELKEIQAKLVYLKESGQHYKAYKLNAKMKKAVAKAKYNETKKPSKFRSIFKKSVDAVKNVASDVIDGAPDVIAKAKEIVTNAAEDVAEKVTPVINKIKKPTVPLKIRDYEVGKGFVGKSLTELDKPTTTSLQGAVGQAYEGGTSDEITKNGTVYKRGEDGYDAVAEELLAQKAAQEEKRKTIKKKK